MTSIGRICICIIVDFCISSRLGRAMSVMIQALVGVVQPTYSAKRSRLHHAIDPPHHRLYDMTMDDFTAEIRSRFDAPLQMNRLLKISAELQAECRDRLQKSSNSMLPSYQHTLPTGQESGDFLALDVGGSTLRIALIKLNGKRQNGGNETLQVRRIRSFVIDKIIRDLKGQEFFDWMADRIAEMLAEYQRTSGVLKGRLPMGLAWSFPIEQTSPRSGRLLSMGKGFYASCGLEGEDLSELIQNSCEQKGLKVEMRAIVNDGTATLLTQAYRDPTTRMSLIVGTGTNAGVFFPVSALGKDKFGQRPDSWYAAAKHVLVNTEVSMVGKNILPTTKWDDELNAKHRLPDFQPLEYLITGRYLGEIARLIVVDAVEHAGLFDGHLPDRFEEAYGFDTRILSIFEADTTSTLEKGRTALLSAHPFRGGYQPRLSELEFFRETARLVSRRAAAFLATALHALWTLRAQLENLPTTASSGHVTVACDGTIVEKYPGFRATCQAYLDELCISSGAAAGAVTLEMAPESSIFGAAVAVACMEGKS